MDNTQDFQVTWQTQQSQLKLEPLQAVSNSINTNKTSLLRSYGRYCKTQNATSQITHSTYTLLFIIIPYTYCKLSFFGCNEKISFLLFCIIFFGYICDQ
jgi:hypothetical protein